MQLSDFVEIIEANGKGVRAYRECARTAREALKSEPEQMTALFVLASAADKFIDAYDDQPLNGEEAEKEFLRFKSYVETLESASDAAAMVMALNKVVSDVVNLKS